jgi:glutathione S-transferase
MTSINTLKLFYAPGACSVSPHIALCEAELPFDIVKVDLRAKTLPGGEDFNLVNPKGSVPALQLQDGQILTETAVMLQYIADLKPEANLFPEQGTFERYRAQEWLNFIAMELHRGLGIFFSPLATD